jgi:hypothetical protein
MTPNSPTGAVDAMLRELHSPNPAKRRAAARMFRRLRIPSTGPALLEALRTEVRDPRAWETQYQLIMAVGECAYRDGLPFLLERLKLKRQETMIGVALGDAIVRLSRSHDHDIGPVLQILGGPDRDLIDGAFRAMAMLRMVPPPEAQTTIVEFADHLPPDDPLKLWAAAAAAGWHAKGVRGFLDRCRHSPRQDVRRAAEASSAGKYLHWTPL